MILSEAAKIKFGLHATPGIKGGINYIQAKHFDDNAELIQPFGTYLEFSYRLENHLLESGDILLPGKGFRNFAWVFEESLGPSIASSLFFVIKPKKEILLPQYLNTFLNTPKIQKYFLTLGAGSSIPSIRKSELEALPITLPPLAMQHKIIELSRIHDQDMELSKQIMEKKQKVYQAVIENLIYQNHE